MGVTSSSSRRASERTSGDRALLELRGIERLYTVGGETVHALDGVDLDVETGEYIAIMGSSGSGKSTLMNLLGCLDTPTRGTYHLDSHPVHALGDDALADVRNRRIGFVFQSFHLLPRLDAVSNVALPLFYREVPRPEREDAARQALADVGLADRASHRPNELSGGQRQRVAIARALVANPAIVLADEPTGNLDSRTSAEVMDLFDRLSSEGRTLILVTHEDDIAARARRQIRLADGKVVEDRLSG